MTAKKKSYEGESYDPDMPQAFSGAGGEERSTKAKGSVPDDDRAGETKHKVLSRNAIINGNRYGKYDEEHGCFGAVMLTPAEVMKLQARDVRVVECKDEDKLEVTKFENETA